MAEAAGQLGKMVEHPNPSQSNPGLRADETPCIISGNFEIIEMSLINSPGAPNGC